MGPPAPQEERKQRRLNASSNNREKPGFLTLAARHLHPGGRSCVPPVEIWSERGGDLKGFRRVVSTINYLTGRSWSPEVRSGGKCFQKPPSDRGAPKRRYPTSVVTRPGQTSHNDVKNNDVIITVDILIASLCYVLGLLLTYLRCLVFSARWRLSVFPVDRVWFPVFWGLS